MSSATSLPPNLATYVAEFVTRARKQAILRATGQAAAVFFGWALACCMADRVLQLPPWARLGALAVGLLAVIVILARPLRVLLRRRVDWAEAAATVERHNPWFAQRLVTVTSRLLGPPEHRGSDDLLYRLLSDVEGEAAGRRPSRAVGGGAILLPWLTWAMLVALSAWLTGWENVGLPRLAARFVAPMSDVEPVTTTRLAVAPGDTKLIQSQPLRVEVSARRLPPNGVVWLTWSDEGGGSFRRVMERLAAGTAATAGAGVGDTMSAGVEEGGRFTLTLPAVERDLRYHVSAGDAETHDYVVQVLRPPAVAGFRIRYVYPAYTDRPPLTVTNTDGLIEAPAGTDATVTVTATEPLQSALLRLGDQKILMARPRGEAENVRRATFKLTRDVAYELDLISTRDVAGGGPPGTVVRTVSDRKPLVRLLNAGEGLRLNPRDILPLAYQALDDFGIESLVVRAQAGGGAPTDFPVPREGDSRRMEGTFNFDLAGVKLGVGDVLTLSLVAKDRAGQQESSETLQVLVSPRSIDLETHQRITELEAAAQLAGLVQEELEATARAFEEAQSQRDKDAEAASAAAGRGNRFLTTATDTAVLVRQSVLRAIVRSGATDLGGVLVVAADSTHLLAAGGEDVFRTNGMAGGDDNAVRENLGRLLDRAGKLREQLQRIAHGERAAALLADRENLAASEKRAAADPQAAQRIRQTLQRAAEDVAAGAKGMGLDPAAPNLDDLLRAKVQAEHAVVQAQLPF
jgi:hypothetical protein